MADAEVRKVEELFRTFIAAFNEGDFDALRSMYTRDAVVIPPGSPEVQGADTIADQLWKPMFEAFTADAQLPADEIRLNGSHGFVRGTYAMKLRPKGDADPMEEKGRYIDIVERDEKGEWRISRAIWNAS